jgi:hypothetical protein
MCKSTTFFLIKQELGCILVEIQKKSKKYLRISKKSSTFASQFGQKCNND